MAPPLSIGPWYNTKARRPERRARARTLECGATAPLWRGVSGKVITIAFQSCAIAQHSKCLRFPISFAFLFPNRLCGCLLKSAADVAGVAVRKIRALHHQHIGDAFYGIDPRLRAPCASVAETAGREHSGYSVVRCAQDARAEAPAIVRA